MIVEPLFRLSVVEFEDIVKSWTVYVVVRVWDSVLTEPVIVRAYVPACPVQARLVVPNVPRIMLAGASWHDRPVLGLTVYARLTVPENPSRPTATIVSVPCEPAFTVTLLVLSTSVKSCTANVAVAEWASPLSVPVTVTVYTPPGPLQERLEVAETPSRRNVGVRLHVTPDGETDWRRVTFPVKPFKPAMVMVELAGVPAITVALVGLAAIVKSTTE